jgi:glyoxylase-like metal-dependent hydrolase (beta-lactamase superfamily II)
MKRLVITCGVLLGAFPSGAHESKTLDELLAGWGSDPADAVVRVETLKPGLHALFAAGGTAIVSIGDQGVLMVDDQFPQVLPKLKTAIRELGGSEIDFVINTHWHFDHADNNPQLGAEGTWIVAHTKSRQKMTGTATIQYDGYSYDQPPYPLEGLPVFTFDDRMQIHFNGQKIDLMYFGPAHTTGDAIVWFRHDNVVHVGDLYSSGYPYIDAANGGTLAGLISVCRSIGAAIDEDTVIVSGHSGIASYDDLTAYIAMLQDTHGKLEKLIDSGVSLEDILDDTLAAGFDQNRGDPTLFLSMAYLSFAH